MKKNVIIDSNENYYMYKNKQKKVVVEEDRWTVIAAPAS